MTTQFPYTEAPTMQARREAQWEEMLRNLAEAGSSVRFIEMMYKQFWQTMAFMDAR